MNDELYHYGVKGMKWGVRRAEKQALRNQQRGEKYLTKTQKKINRSRENASYARKELNTLKKEGHNSDRIRQKTYDNIRSEVDFKSTVYEAKSGRKTSELTKEGATAVAYLIGGEKARKQTYDQEVADYEAAVKRYTDNGKKWQAANSAVMNMPLNSSNRDYRKAIRRAKRYVNL